MNKAVLHIHCFGLLRPAAARGGGRTRGTVSGTHSFANDAGRWWGDGRARNFIGDSCGISGDATAEEDAGDAAGTDAADAPGVVTCLCRWAERLVPVRDRARRPSGEAADAVDDSVDISTSMADGGADAGGGDWGGGLACGTTRCTER